MGDHRLALIEGCKHSVEITIPGEEVRSETTRVLADLQKKIKLPGFRPGKVPTEMIRKRFPADVQEEVLKKLIPRFLQQKFDEDHLDVVGTPNVKDVHFHEGEDVHFKAEFEVAPQIELGQYTDIEVVYSEPEVKEEEIEQRLSAIRDQKADYVNVDPRPLEDGDFAVVSLESTEPVDGKPIRNEETMLHIGDPDTMPEFSENLRGASPGDTREFSVTYPEEFAQTKLAGKTVPFRAEVKGIRRKELPELNDEFAQDVGDFQNLEELHDAVRRAIHAEKEYTAQAAAKNQLIEKLVEAHDFPVPEAYIERQIQILVESRLRELASHGVDPRSLNLDWEKIQETQRERAVRDVKASLLLDRIGDRESISATNDEVDQEVQRIARQQREPVAAVRMRLEKERELGRIAGRIRTDKTLSFLFERARKSAPTE
jgi:trigger factor